MWYNYTTEHLLASEMIMKWREEEMKPKKIEAPLHNSP